MAILSRPKFNPQQRLDLEDINALLSALRTDAKLWTKQFLSENSQIVKGFAVSGVGLKEATVAMTDATLILPQNDFDFSWYTSAPGEADIVVPDAELVDNTRNYLELEVRTQEGTPLTKAFWDPEANSGDGAEFNQIVNTITDLSMAVVVSTAGFSGLPGRVPLAIVDTDVNGNIKIILDRRELFGRLSKPNDLDNKYTWGNKQEPVYNTVLSGVTGTFLDGEEITINAETATVVTGGTASITFQTPTGINFSNGDVVTGSVSGATGTLDTVVESFAGVDKSLSSFKEVIDAIYTEIAVLKGSRFWWQDTAKSITGISDSEHTIIVGNSAASNSRWFWSGTNLTLTDDDMAPSAFDPIATLVTLGRTRVINLTRQDGQDGSSTIAIADGEVLYVDRSGSTDKNIDEPGALEDNFQLVTSNSYVQSDGNYWLAYRVGSRLYVRGIGELESGESAQISDNINENILTAIGLDNETSLPNYTSTNAFPQNSSLVAAISALDLVAGDLAWKTPVADVASLPLVDNVDGDVRLVLDTRVAYHWNEADNEWVPLTNGGGLKLIGGGTFSVNETTPSTLTFLDGTFDIGYSGPLADRRIGQSFTPDNNGVVQSFTAQFRGVEGDAVGEIIAYLRENDGGTPGAILATSTNGYDITTLPGNYVDVTFNFNNPSVLNGTLYFLEISFENIVDTNAFFQIQRNNSNVYAGGSRFESSNGGVNYTIDTFDLNFEINFGPTLGLNFTEDAYLEKSGLLYQDNTISVANSPIALPNDKDVAYVNVNLNSLVSATSLQQSDDSDQVLGFNTSQTTYYYQTFTAGLNTLLQSVQLRNYFFTGLGGVPNPPQLRSLDIVQVIAGVPTDNVLYTSTNALTITNSLTDPFEFNDEPLVSGTQYAFRLQISTNSSTTQGIGLLGSDSNPLTGEKAFYRIGAGPIEDTGIENSDFYFDLQGQASLGLLNVIVDTLNNVPPTASIIARRDGDSIIVGTSSTKLKLGESMELYGSKTDQDKDKMRGADYGFFRSDEPVVWTGSEVQFTQDIVLEMLNKDGVEQTYTVAVADSPVSIADGAYLYLIVDRTLSSQTLQFQTGSLPAIPDAGQDIVVFGKRKDVLGAGYLHLPLHKQVLEPGQAVRLGASGSGGGNASSFIETLKNRLNDSIFQALTPYVSELDTDDAGLIDPLSTGSYDIVTKLFKLQNAGDTLVSADLLDEDFKDSSLDLDKAEVIVKYNEDGIDPDALYELSKDGGTNWLPVTAERVANTDTFRGILQFSDGPNFNMFAEDSVTGDDATFTSALTLYAQEVTFAEEFFARKAVLNVAALTGSPLGNIQVKLVKESGGLPSSDANDILATASPIAVQSLTPGEVEFDISAIIEPGTYFITVEADAAYAASYSAGVDELVLNANASGSGAFSFSAGGAAPSPFSQTIAANFEILDATNEFVAQSFTTTSSVQIASVAFEIIRSSTPSGPITIEVREDLAGSPGSLVLNGISNSIDASTLSTGTGSPPVFTFANKPVLNSTTKYWVVLNTSGTNIPTGGTLLGVGRSNLDTIAGEGWQRSNDSGSTYGATDARDLYMVVNAEELPGWISTGGSLTHRVEGFQLDLRLRVTSSINDVLLEGFGVLFDQSVGDVSVNKDQSFINSILLEENRLGSTNPLYDNSKPGEGILLRASNGTLVEAFLEWNGVNYQWAFAEVPE